jgi:hypothetical protein
MALRATTRNRYTPGVSRNTYDRAPAGRSVDVVRLSTWAFRAAELIRSAVTL